MSSKLEKKLFNWLNHGFYHGLELEFLALIVQVLVALKKHDGGVERWSMLKEEM